MWVTYLACWRTIGDEIKLRMVVCSIAIPMVFIHLLLFIGLGWKWIVVWFACFFLSILASIVDLSNTDIYEAILSWCYLHCWFDVISCATKNPAEFNSMPPANWINRRFGRKLGGKRWDCQCTGFALGLPMPNPWPSPFITWLGIIWLIKSRCFEAILWGGFSLT